MSAIHGTTVTLDERKRVKLPGRLGFRKGQVFAVEVRAEGVLLVPLKPERFEGNGRIQIDERGVPFWDGPVPQTPVLDAIEQMRNERINEALR